MPHVLKIAPPVDTAPPEDDRLWSVAETAAFTGFCQETIRRMIRRGRIKGIPFRSGSHGLRYRIPGSVVRQIKAQGWGQIEEG